jgi:hypothetical protein
MDSAVDSRSRSWIRVRTRAVSAVNELPWSRVEQAKSPVKLNTPQSAQLGRLYTVLLNVEPPNNREL